ncbi:unnamed protein product [Staurois parvus]|uniref:Uncharacterized protein n=1 Tax=Staurois parvus TaxID=386267 RepID=A0ABN9EXV5_9NEOB|nr:unnamed protein product [Staurois parvus]
MRLKSQFLGKAAISLLQGERLHRFLGRAALSLLGTLALSWPSTHTSVTVPLRKGGGRRIKDE